jgi:3-vinyl bacteriochlorophyllide hydratase
MTGIASAWEIKRSDYMGQSQPQDAMVATIAMRSKSPKMGRHWDSSQPLYTPEQRRLRDESKWTLVQGILAPIQFLVLLISVGLVLRYFLTGEGAAAATVSIVVKTMILYVIMVTGSIWEKVVFDEWLFAPPFFWEDAFSMIVLALHTAYLVALLNDWGTPAQQMSIALAGYGAYVINAGQFILKLRAARLQAAAT